ncbi:MAG: helix-turn-helix domain-containing protein [Acidobacteria bacterium]|nr:helix-turn-helix domain-containing protein [Acidobacteriota bacterium]MCA1609782.1 helix-turn-helix domain-containing protein [Acidobacteriota bacterium]
MTSRLRWFGHVASLRQKIEDNPARADHIVTVHRLGYRFVG